MRTLNWSLLKTPAPPRLRLSSSPLAFAAGNWLSSLTAGAERRLVGMQLPVQTCDPMVSGPNGVRPDPFAAPVAGSNAWFKGDRARYSLKSQMALAALPQVERIKALGTDCR